MIVLDGGRIVLRGATAEVLADPRLEATGVAPPSAVRLRRAAEAAGLDPSLVAGEAA